MTFADLLAPLKAEQSLVSGRGVLSVPITNVTDDSREVGPGSVFVAVKGGHLDGHAFLPQAIRQGAAALVVQDPLPEVEETVSVPVVRVGDSRRAVGLLAARLLGDPSQRLQLIGVTGTNGKTTITYLCKGLLETAGHCVGLIGTVAYLIGAERQAAAHTTPGAVALQRLLANMVRAGVDAAVMEVSSHALALDRVAGCEFDVAVFTNLTQDHLDFHRDMEEYFQAKLRLFTGLGAGARKRGAKRAIVNMDDPRGNAVCAAASAPVWTYAIHQPADLRAESLDLKLRGTRFIAVTPAGRFPVESRLVGEHNVSNMLAAIGVGVHLGLSPVTIQAGLQSVETVPGRFERVEAGQDFTVVVDYAHTEDALLRLLVAAHALKTGRIILVFGCGGDRDRGKRPKMGRAAAHWSDLVFLTTDNPRTEDPLAILADVEVGVREALDPARTRYHVIPDRRAAIEAAVREARSGDTVLIAGKGHEDYQIVGTTRLHFDDREVARKAILKLAR